MKATLIKLLTWSEAKQKRAKDISPLEGGTLSPWLLCPDSNELKSIAYCGTCPHCRQIECGVGVRCLFGANEAVICGYGRREGVCDNYVTMTIKIDN